MIKNSYNAEETYQIGMSLGENAEPGQVYCLIGDLGVGKTVFSQGFAKGLGIHEAINSPTFTIVQEYLEGRLPFYHFDVYRISSAEEMEDIGYEEYFYSGGVCLVEWGNLIEELLPKETIWINIDKDIQVDFDFRKIVIEGAFNDEDTSN